MKKYKVYVMFCAGGIIVQFKKREKRPWRSVIFNKVADFTVSNTSPWVFFTFLNCTNGTKLHIAPHLKAVGILILLYF